MESLQPTYLLIIGVLLGALITWMLSRPQLVELKELTFSNENLENVIDVKMKYKSEGDLTSRLMYKYRLNLVHLL